MTYRVTSEKELPGMTTTLQVKQPRTLLEELIRQRQQTFEEFAEDAEQFARHNGEPGTLSVRHLQRLAAGRRPDGRPLGRPRPATARLLERIFGTTIADLLGPPTGEAESPEVFRVAVAIVVRDQRVLMVRRRADDHSGISWQFPAGIVKPGMQAEDVAVSETLGETAVHCVPLRKIGSRVHPLTKVLCEYVLCEYVGGHAANSDLVENSGVLWAEQSDLTKLVPAERIYPQVLSVLGLRA